MLQPGSALLRWGASAAHVAHVSSVRAEIDLHKLPEYKKAKAVQLAKPLRLAEKQRALCVGSR